MMGKEERLFFGKEQTSMVVRWGYKGLFLNKISIKSGTDVQ